MSNSVDVYSFSTRISGIDGVGVRMDYCLRAYDRLQISLIYRGHSYYTRLATQIDRLAGLP
ncbi:MAG: hypothetical protein AB8B64_06295 [Granulosicoccus sp.]